MKKIPLGAAGLLLLGLLLSTPAQSALVYDWIITNPTQTVSPTDVVSVNGQFINDVTSTVALDLDAAVTQAFTSFSANIFAEYTPKFGPEVGNILSQFDGVVINPGEVFDFVFATMTPNPAPVAADLYALTLPGLTVNGLDDRTGSALFTVEAPTGVVPVPAAVWLFGTALIGLVGFSKRRKAA